MLLADEATRLLHGPESLSGIHSKLKQLFVSSPSSRANSNDRGDSNECDDADISESDSSLSAPFVCNFKDSAESRSVFSILYDTKLSSSKKQARLLIKAGAVRIGDKKIADEFESLLFQNIYGSDFILSVGKKKFARIKFTMINDTGK